LDAISIYPINPGFCPLMVLVFRQKRNGGFAAGVAAFIKDDGINDVSAAAPTLLVRFFCQAYKRLAVMK
jgi:hypothetical protein